MPINDEAAAIDKIKKTYKNLATTIGSLAVFIIIMCAFTIGSFADSDHSYFIWIEAGVSLLMILILIVLKPISFFLTRLWLGGRKRYKETFASLSVADMKE